MATCFLCDAQMTPLFKTRDHLRPQISTEYPVEWCESCAFGKVAASFSPQDVSAFYTEGYYTHVTSGDSSATASPFLDRLRVHLAWRTDRGVDLSPSEAPRICSIPALCDVGCGSGGAMSKFKQTGYEVVGIEPDPAARALAAKIGEVYDGTAEALPASIEGRLFDVVLLSHVLEHCIDPATALANVNRLLAPRGTAIIEVPNNAAAAFSMYGPSWFFADIPRHLQFFTEKSLHAALARSGLRVTNTIYTGYTRQFSPEWLTAQEQIRTNTGLDRQTACSGNIWSLLAKTSFAPPEKKYDSIRVHAVHDTA